MKVKFSLRPSLRVSESESLSFTRLLNHWLPDCIIAFSGENFENGDIHKQRENNAICFSIEQLVFSATDSGKYRVKVVEFNSVI